MSHNVHGFVAYGATLKDTESMNGGWCNYDEWDDVVKAVLTKRLGRMPTTKEQEWWWSPLPLWQEHKEDEPDASIVTGVVRGCGDGYEEGMIVIRATYQPGGYDMFSPFNSAATIVDEATRQRWDDELRAFAKEAGLEINEPRWYISAWAEH